MAWTIWCCEILLNIIVILDWLGGVGWCWGLGGAEGVGCVYIPFTESIISYIDILAIFASLVSGNFILKFYGIFRCISILILSNHYSAGCSIFIPWTLIHAKISKHFESIECKELLNDEITMKRRLGFKRWVMISVNDRLPLGTTRQGKYFSVKNSSEVPRTYFAYLSFW